MNPKLRAARPGLRPALLALFAFNAVYFPEFFPPANNPNELSRIQAIVAFVERGTFAIDSTVKKWGDHQDTSFYGGHTYSNKAPGLIFAGATVYRILRFFAPEPASPRSPMFVITRLLTVTLVSLLALARFSRRLAREPFRDETGIVTLAVAFGTPFLFYGRSFFSHAWTASLLFLAWDDVLSSEERGGGTARTVRAGFLAAFAAISEYTAAPIALLLGLRVLWGGRFRALARFCAGAFIPLLLLLIYDAVCFGSPWSLSSAHEHLPAYAEAARHGLFGVGRPSIRVVAGFFFDPSRGILLFSPFWLWTIAGFVSWWRSGRSRRDCILAAAAVVSGVGVLSGYGEWEGGYCLGPRYLLPLIFFAALGIPFAVRSRWSRSLFALAVSFSVAQSFLLCASWPYIARDVIWPVANISWWALERRWVAPNLGRMAGLPAAWSLVLPGAATAAILWLLLRSQFSRRPALKATMSVAAGIGALALLIAYAPPLPGGGGWRDWLIHFLE